MPLVLPKLMLLDSEAVPPPVLFVAAIRLMTRLADVFRALLVIADVALVCWNRLDWDVLSAAEVIADVALVNCKPCVMLSPWPVPLANVMPLPSRKLTVPLV